MKEQQTSKEYINLVKELDILFPRYDSNPFDDPIVQAMRAGQREVVQYLLNALPLETRCDIEIETIKARYEALRHNLEEFNVDNPGDY